MLNQWAELQPADFAGPLINDITNGVLLTATDHDYFDRYELWFEKVSVHIWIVMLYMLWSSTDRRKDK